MVEFSGAERPRTSAGIRDGFGEVDQVDESLAEARKAMVDQVFRRSAVSPAHRDNRGRAVSGVTHVALRAACPRGLPACADGDHPLMNCIETARNL